MNKRGRGRPSGETGARHALVAVARRRFLAEGYDRVTLRSVAAEAGVDVALVAYHFGSKRGLFGAALSLGANPAQLVGEVFAGPLDTAPERLVRAVLAAWDDPVSGPRLRRLGEQAVRDPDVARLFREVVEREMVPAVAARLGGADATARAGTAVTVVAGLVLTRYLLVLEPQRSMPVDELTARLAPLVRAALAGPPRSARLPTRPRRDGRPAT